MHDDDLHPDHELASAYLDGDVTEVERAQVEASPELSALVATMRDLRTQLADVSPVSAITRQAALAAMLAEFDHPTQSAGDGETDGAAAVVAPAAPSNVISLSSRRQWPKRVMSAAAGLLIVGAAGVAINGNLGSSSDSKSSSATVEMPKAGMTAGGQDQREGAPPPTIGSIMGAGSVAVEINDPQALLALAQDNLSVSSVGGGAGTSATTGDTTSIADNAPATTTAADLTSAPESFAPTVAVAQVLPPELTACPDIRSDDVSLGAINYRGTFAFAVVHSSGEVIAITDTCTVLATAGP